MKKDISIIIPALNEEKNIVDAVQSVIGTIKDYVDDYEIIVIDDGSKDRTFEVASKISESNPKVRVYSNEKNSGFGYSFRRGVQLATKNYIGEFPGDNDASSELFQGLIQQMDSADVVTSYMDNLHVRPFFRRVLSRSFVILINTLFGQKLKYYNGPLISRREILQSVQLKSDGLTVLAECLVRLLKKGYSHKEIPFKHVGRKGGKSTALSLKSIRHVIKSIFVLTKDIYFSKGKTKNV